MKLTELKFNSEEYKNSLTFREEILRKPLNLKFTQADLSGEESQFHYAIFSDSEKNEAKIIACVSFKPLNDEVIKLRQMAVSNSFQGQGLGKRLIEFSEIEIQKKGYLSVEMAARKTAIKFYEKLGYQIIGKEFIEVGIAHVMMKKFFR